MAWEAWTDDAVVDSAVACSAVDGRSCVVGVVAVEIVPALVLVVDAGGDSLCMAVAPLTVSRESASVTPPLARGVKCIAAAGLKPPLREW